jgi:hypothetical protein
MPFMSPTHEALNLNVCCYSNLLVDICGVVVQDYAPSVSSQTRGIVWWRKSEATANTAKRVETGKLEADKNVIGNGGVTMTTEVRGE